MLPRVSLAVSSCLTAVLVADLTTDAQPHSAAQLSIGCDLKMMLNFPVLDNYSYFVMMMGILNIYWFFACPPVASGQVF